MPAKTAQLLNCLRQASNTAQETPVHAVYSYRCLLHYACRLAKKILCIKVSTRRCGNITGNYQAKTDPMLLGVVLVALRCAWVHH